MDTKALRQKILDLAIRGKLVPQDPTDEPASVLLERIRAQKQQMVKEGKLKAKDIKNDTVIFVGEANLHYEKHADGTVKCIEDEIPFEVPEGWEWCRCRNVVELSSGQDLEPQRYNSNGAGIPYITGASNLSGGHVIINRWTETPTTHATINDLLLTCKGSGVGKMAICDIEDAHIARQIMALRCTSAICLSYLQVMMSAFITEITFQANGIIPGIRREIVLETLFPLPPYNEQIQIGDRCNALTDLVNAVDIDQTEMLSLVGSIKAKILDLAIRGQLIAQSPDDEPASVLLDHIRAEKEALIKQGKIKRDKRESVIFRGDDNSYYERVGQDVVDITEELPFSIPDSWCWARISSVFEINPRNKLNDELEVSFIPMPLIEDGFSGRHTSEIKKWSAVKTGFTHFSEGDIGIAKITPCFENRKSTVFCNLVNGFGAGTTELHVLRSYGNMILPEYALAFVKNQAFIDNGKQEFTGAVGQQRVGKDYISETLFPVPPYQEQVRIVEAIRRVFSTISTIEAAIA